MATQTTNIETSDILDIINQIVTDLDHTFDMLMMIFNY